MVSKPCRNVKEEYQLDKKTDAACFVRCGLDYVETAIRIPRLCGIAAKVIAGGG
jgi:hypothetical protein